MRWFSRQVERFCLHHPRFGIPNLMLYVVIGNAVVWLFSLMDRSGMLIGALCFLPSAVLRGQVWRLLTFALIPDSSGLWTLIFLYFYYFIGNTLERQMGPTRFTLYFFSGLLLTVIFGFVLYLFGYNVMVDAHYIYLSMFFAFAACYPDQMVLLFFVIPVKMKWLAVADAVLFVIGIVTNPFPICLLPVVAVLNVLLFFGDELLSAFFPNRARFRPRNVSNTVKFKQAARQVRREQEKAPYRFKCAVCGRTDQSDPGLEFRYCSRCEGYHCFCQDHINSHIHFTQ